MVINDLLRPRQEVIDPEVNFQHAIRAYRVKDKEDRLESNPARFFATTYPSNAIRNVIKLANQKLTGIDNQGGIVLAGAYGSGKSHALITLYNIFAYPEQAESWINYHNIKFNLATIQDNSKSSILSTSKVDPDKLWEPIMRELDKEEIINKIDRYPTVDDIEELIGDDYTAIFIDELERWFGSFNPEQEDHLIEANKMFIQNLLELAADNEKLFVFIGFLEENRELKEIINRSKPRKEDMAATGDREKIIIHRLFKTPKEEVNRNEVEKIVDDYLAEYEKVELDFENRQKYRAKMIDSYPFHPELLSVLDDIYDEASTEKQNIRGELQILVDVVKKKYLDKDMFLISDLDGRSLQGIDYQITGRFRSDIRVCRENNIEYSQEILTSILLYTLDPKRGVAEKEDIFLSTIRPEEVSGIDVEIGMGELLGVAHYLHKEESGYLFKDQRNVFALIQSNAEKIRDEEGKEELAYYIRDQLFDRRYKIYGYDELEDSSKVKYILLLDSPHERKELEEFLEQEIYYGRQYQNTLAIIKPSRDIFTEKFITKMKRIMAARQLEEELNEGKEKIAETLESEIQELTRELKGSFGRYLRWASSGKQTKIRQEVVEADHEAVREKIKTDKSAVKDYIITKVKGQETGRVVEELLADCKKYRRNPFISNDSDFTNVVKELYNDKRVYLEGDNNKIYRGERVSIQARWAVLDPEYHPEVAEELSDDHSEDINIGSPEEGVNSAEVRERITAEQSNASEEVKQVIETEPVEIHSQGNSNRLLISQVETQLRAADQINKVVITINFGEKFSKEDLKELLLKLPDKEGSYSLEVRGERECD
ncbi:DUF499 domain-containing protein [Fuchsiella alkaliacetigena]|uniref:DUF499 domain-containing protein n=1 Tax=Fuchsiella alkaliacetigena TaxID=957042 RepID=UPI002009F80C|nr:DUF499 domain-containing protein [Fuchsiella alkaliacetigena]MCK8825903.1 DUF499 domain-containing protein [Fuchsiella alkaliacetigena]